MVDRFVVRALLSGMAVGLFAGGVAGTLEWPVVGTLAGAVGGVACGLVLSPLTGLVLGLVRMWTGSRQIASLVGVCAAAASAVALVLVAGSWLGLSVAASAATVLSGAVLGGALGPYVVFGVGQRDEGRRSPEPPARSVGGDAAVAALLWAGGHPPIGSSSVPPWPPADPDEYRTWRARPASPAELFGRVVLAGLTVGAVAGLGIGLLVHWQTAPFALMEGGLFGMVSGTVLAVPCWACALVTGRSRDGW